MRISETRLRKHGACIRAAEKFGEDFPGGFRLTRKNLMAWVARNRRNWSLLSDLCWLAEEIGSHYFALTMLSARFAVAGRPGKWNQAAKRHVAINFVEWIVDELILPME